MTDKLELKYIESLSIALSLKAKYTRKQKHLTNEEIKKGQRIMKIFSYELTNSIRRDITNELDILLTVTDRDTIAYTAFNPDEAVKTVKETLDVIPKKSRGKTKKP